MGDLVPGGPAVSSAERLKIDTGPANPCRAIIYSTHFPLGVLGQNNEIINSPMAYHVIDNFVDGLPKVSQKSWRFDAQREIIRLLPGKAERETGSLQDQTTGTFENADIQLEGGLCALIRSILYRLTMSLRCLLIRKMLKASEKNIVLHLVIESDFFEDRVRALDISLPPGQLRQTFHIEVRRKYPCVVSIPVKIIRQMDCHTLCATQTNILGKN